MAKPSVVRFCTKCQQVSEFYPSNQGPCKACRKLRDSLPEVRERHYAAVERYRKSAKGKIIAKKITSSDRWKERSKAWCKSEKGRAAAKAYRQTEAYKAMKRCHVAVYRLIKAGVIPHPTLLPCTYCGHAAKEYHHHNGYLKEHAKDVVPVCTTCHDKLQRAPGKWHVTYASQSQACPNDIPSRPA